MSKRQVRQLAPDPVTLLLVKGKRLEAHRVQMGMVTAAPAGFGFGRGEQPRPESLSADFFIQPQDADMQPTPIRLPKQAAGQSSIGIPYQEDEFPMVGRRRMPQIESFQTLPDEFDVGFGWIFFQNDGWSRRVGHRLNYSSGALSLAFPHRLHRRAVTEYCPPGLRPGVSPP